MVTPAQLALLRDWVNELDDTNGWNDEKLTAVLESVAEDVKKAAAIVWQAKAAAMTTLHDITESGSSRRLSQSFEHALQMAAQFGTTLPDVTATEVRPVSQRIVRPTRG